MYYRLDKNLLDFSTDIHSKQDYNEINEIIKFLRRNLFLQTNVEDNVEGFFSLLF